MTIQVKYDTELPVTKILPQLREFLTENNRLILSAPPGAGKTTVVPTALLSEPWARDSRIIIMQPRRAAVKAVAKHISRLLDSKPGDLVGWQIRGEKFISKHTRIEIVTDGILVRRMQRDPALSGYGIVIFDEFHERGIYSDFSLTMALDIQENLRPDLKLLVMSATLEVERLKEFLNAPAITCSGRVFPIENRYSPVPVKRNEMVQNIVKTTLRLLEHESGSILVFLPGASEINTAAVLLQSSLPQDTIIARLYGNLSQQEQDMALTPAKNGCRKVVLATNIAETSLTIEGISIVIDSGMVRKNQYDVGIGIPTLRTVRISKASAEQRRGRAGRMMPGICIRMWSEYEQQSLSAFDLPEITETDLTPLCLELAAWGSSPEQLRWLDSPPEAAVNAGNKLLQELGALDMKNCITAFGRELVRLPVHPRLAAMLIQAEKLEMVPLAAEIAAIIEEREFYREGDNITDLGLKIVRLRQFEHSAYDNGVLSGVCHRIIHIRNQLLQLLDCKYKELDVESVGLLLAFAYPDRIGRQRHSGGLNYLLSSGRGATFSVNDPLVSCKWIVAGRLDGAGVDARIMLAASIKESSLKEHFASSFKTTDDIQYDQERKQFTFVRNTRLKAIILKSTPLNNPSPENYAVAIIDFIRNYGLQVIDFDDETTRLLHRLRFARKSSPEEWPDWSEITMIERLDEWLRPLLGTTKSLNELKDINLKNAIIMFAGYPTIRKLDCDFPERFTVPSGSSIRIDYSGDIPGIAVKLQEMYGCSLHPAINHGMIKLKVTLLSPAMRPVQITSDVPGLWRGSWTLIQKEMKGRYPKHFWPDKPENELPSNRSVRRKISSA